MPDLPTPHGHIEITHEDFQRALGWIYEIADGPSANPNETPEDSRDVSIAMKLGATALAMKPQYEHAASVIVSTYCDLIGIDHYALKHDLLRLVAEHRVVGLGKQIDEGEDHA
ncbi:hypothetical protein BX598_1885 [Micrococcaceae bacterium JKS001869]|nr:hypothetical protein BX598_1885 [Micrococcaceae bacterium JKS001869]